MTAPTMTRRTAVLSLFGIAVLLVILRPAGESSSLKALSSKASPPPVTSSEHRYEDYLAHSSESAALPLVSSIASFDLPKSPEDRVNVSICAIATHEEQYLPEWLTWHRLVGVERFYLFDNDPSLEMRRLLRPWIEEGTVILFELMYPEGTDIGSVYQQDALRMCENFALPYTNWASHHDVDEFLMVDAHGWESPIPLPVPTIEAEAAPSSSQGFTYPLHARFSTLLKAATCLPMLRIPFQNYGQRRLGLDAYLTERQTVRDKIPPNHHTYGKMFIHSDGNNQRAGWMGPHSCRKPPGTVVMDPGGNRIPLGQGAYPYEGLPLPQEGIYLFHYVQRSLEDCERKFHVVSGTQQDWRTRDGLDGCARNYVPTDHDLADPAARAELEALPHGDLVLQRPDAWKELFMRDTSARDSWQGRMTRAIVDGWRAQSRAGVDEGWFWERGDEAAEESLLDLENIWLITDVRKATMAGAVLSNM